MRWLLLVVVLIWLALLLAASAADAQISTQGERALNQLFAPGPPPNVRFPPLTADPDCSQPNSDGKFWRNTTEGAVKTCVGGSPAALGGGGVTLEALNPMGAWSAATTYAEFDSVSHLGSYWVSNTAGNLNNVPGTDPEWDLVVSKGADGKTILSGAGAPNDGSGANGDLYYDTTAKAIYGPKASNSWSGTGPQSLLGPQGAQGIQGPPGAIPVAGGVQSLAAGDAISCGINDVANRTVRVQSADADQSVVLTSDPQIATGSDGQRCTVCGVSSSQSVVVASERGVRLSPDLDEDVIATVELTDEVCIDLWYDSTAATWRQSTTVAGGSAPNGGGGGIQSETQDLNAVYAFGTGGIDNPTCDRPLRFGPEDGYHWRFCMSGGIPLVGFHDGNGNPISVVRNIPLGLFMELLVNGSACEKLTGAGVHTYSGACKPLWTAVWNPAGAWVDGVHCVRGSTAVQVNSGPRTYPIICGDAGAGEFEFNLPTPNRYDGGAITVCTEINDPVDTNSVWDAAIIGQFRASGQVVNNTWSSAVEATATLATAHAGYFACASVTPNGAAAGIGRAFFRATIDNAGSHDDTNGRILGGYIAGFSRSRSD